MPHAASHSATSAAALPAIRATRASLTPAIVSGTTMTAEAALMAATGGLAALLHVAPEELSPVYPLAIAATSLATVVIVRQLGLYRLEALLSPHRAMPRVVLAWGLAITLLATALFLLGAGAELSRVWMTSWVAIGAIGLPAARLLLARAIRAALDSGRLERRVAIYGAGATAAELVRMLERNAGRELVVAGIFDDRDPGRVGEATAGHRHLGGLASLIEHCRADPFDLVVVTLPVAGEKRLASVIKALSVLPVDIKLWAEATELRLSPRAYSRVGGIAMIDLYDKPIADWGSVSKSILDRTLALMALILLAPVMAAVALAIKLDSRGPVLFRQKRYGFNNELIEVLKFRSMYTDKCDADARALVTRGDPRVTPVGRLIRKTSLDELPQLINVLKGDLSLVGPRPHALAAKAAGQLYDEVVEGYFARHKVKPGITGWAQVNGWRGETDTPEKIRQRVAHDLYYIENWSVMLDLLILIRTPFALLETDNAY